MTNVVRAEILSSEILASLASVREDVERHVTGLERYRALLAIEKTIGDFPGLDDLNRSLSEIRERMRQQIEETPEVRALRSVETIMPQLTEVLTFLAERTQKAAAAQTASDQVTGRADDAEDAKEAVMAEPPAGADRHKSDQVTVVIATLEDIVEAPPAPTLDQSQQVTAEPDLRPAIAPAIANADPGEALAPANDAGNSEASGPPAAPPLSYGIAQFLNPDDTSERPASPETLDDGAGHTQFHSPASQEGRAA